MNHEDEVARLGARFQEADAAREAALAELAEAMREAKEDVSVSRMAQLSGLTRKSVYRLIGHPMA